MKLMVTTAAYFQSEDDFRLKCWIFLRSCAKFGISEDVLRLYGCGAPRYTNLLEMRIKGTMEFLEERSEDFTHVLYTDCWDAFFTSGLDEIVEKYEAAGSPPVIARIDDLQGFYQQAEGTNYADKKGRGPTGGSIIAEIPYMIDAFYRMQFENKNESEDLWSWIDSYKKGFFHPTADWKKEIFHNTPGPFECEIRNGRIYNVESEVYPSMFHFGGAYCDPDTGKDYMLRPWAERAGIIEKDEPRSSFKGYPLCWH